MSKSHTDIEAIIKVRAPPTSANNIVLDYIMSIGRVIQRL